ncbi:MAG: nucleotidyltransferase family protein [Bacilli bacterium]
MNPKIAERRDQIIQIASKYRVSNIRIFGSQLRGEETVDSDIDLLVEFEKPDLLNQIAFKQDLEDVLGLPVDILTTNTIHPLLQSRILQEAQPL